MAWFQLTLLAYAAGESESVWSPGDRTSKYIWMWPIGIRRKMAPAVLKSVEDDMVEAWFSIPLWDLLRFDGGDCWSFGMGREG